MIRLFHTSPQTYNPLYGSSTRKGVPCAMSDVRTPFPRATRHRYAIPLWGKGFVMPDATTSHENRMTLDNALLSFRREIPYDDSDEPHSTRGIA